MDAEKTFWDNLKEFGSLDCIDFTFRGREYQAVGDHGDGTSFICTCGKDDESSILAEFHSIDEMLDTAVIDGLSFREIMHSPELTYFCFW